MKDQRPDVEAGPSSDLLYPGITRSENEMRWGFIRKVYGIIGAQLLLTAAVGSCFALIPTVRDFGLTNGYFMFFATILPFAKPFLRLPLSSLTPLFPLSPLPLFPLPLFLPSPFPSSPLFPFPSFPSFLPPLFPSSRTLSPTPLSPLLVFLPPVCLTGQTASMSMTVGLICSMYSGPIVAEALGLTASVVLGLTAYTYYAVKKGQEFSGSFFISSLSLASLCTPPTRRSLVRPCSSYLGPMLYVSLWLLLGWSFIQIFWGLGSEFALALVGALIFALFIVYDTDLIIRRYSYDEYVMASLNIYLDIINLFIRMLEILQYLQGKAPAACPRI
ncbi:unnamed protein product [Closterium sp. NIES-65]|nr:unnamed protein product [Closterium sp. NIES-65]